MVRMVRDMARLLWLLLLTSDVEYKNVRRCISSLVLFCFLLLVPTDVFAATKGGINIGDHLDEFDQAASALGPDSWVYAMACPGDAEKIMELTRASPSINLMLRGHYPGEPLNEDFANAWVAALGDLEDSEFALRQIYFMPVNEPNHPPGAPDSMPASNVKSYIKALTSALEESGLRHTRIQLLSPMLDVHYFMDNLATNQEYIAELGGSDFFNQFDGISLNLYGVYYGPEQPATDFPEIKLGKGYNRFVQQYYGVSKPIFAVESGVVKPGEPVKYKDNSEEIKHYYGEYAGPGWASDSNFKAFTIFSYDPHGEKSPWIYGREDVLDSIKKVVNGGAVEPVVPRDAAAQAVYEAWRRRVKINLDFSEKKCGVVVSCCGESGPIDTPECAQEVTKCTREVMGPAKINFDEGREKEGGGGETDTLGFGTTGLKEAFCRVFGGLPIPGIKHICRLAELAGDVQSIEVSRDILKKKEETGTNVQEIPSLKDLWEKITGRASDPKKGGFLNTYLPRSVIKKQENGVNIAFFGKKEELLDTYDTTRQLLLPASQGSKKGIAERLGSVYVDTVEKLIDQIQDRCGGVIADSNISCLDVIKTSVAGVIDELKGSVLIDGFENLQCVRFVKAAVLLGTGEALAGRSAAIDYATSPPEGYRFIAKNQACRQGDTIQIGDIPVWSNGAYGHMAYVNYVYDTNRFDAAEANLGVAGSVTIRTKTIDCGLDNNLEGWLRVK